MILKSLINVKTDWKPNPYICIDDDICDLYGVALLFYHNDEWHNISSIPDLSSNMFWRSYFELRLKWRFKVWGYVNDEILLLHDEIYNEKYKDVVIRFSNYIYSSHKKWLYQSLNLSKRYNFHPIIVSRFSDRLKHEFPDYESSIFSEKEYEFSGIKNHAYAEYTIKRNVIAFNSSNDWHTEGVFSNNSVFFKSWKHKRDWVGMSDEELFNDIMNYE